MIHQTGDNRSVANHFLLSAFWLSAFPVSSCCTVVSRLTSRVNVTTCCVLGVCTGMT